ncbi:hypothetical protein HDV02_003610 [Globomyces sp. JEL0801]|nr:hypothetical protein HDV02_003610 [Globomyces sp. JEL0801]
MGYPETSSIRNRYRYARFGILGVLLVILAVELFVGFDIHKLPDVPVAEKIPYKYSVNDLNFTDNYHWLKNIRTDDKVKEYIRKENAYTNSWLDEHYAIRKDVKYQLEKDQDDIQLQLNPCFPFDEDLESLWQTDEYVYWSTYRFGNLPTYLRLKRSFNNNCTCYEGDEKSKEEVVMDFNKFLPNYEGYFMVGVFEITTNEKLAAFSVDQNGSELYSLYVWDIEQQRALAGSVDNTYYTARWQQFTFNGQTESWVYYNIVDLKWGVPLGIGRLGPFANNGEEPKSEVIYNEQDISLTTDLHLTNDKNYLFIKIVGQITTEYKLIISKENTRTLTLKEIHIRQPGVVYEVEHNAGFFYVKSNEIASNHQITRHPVGNLKESSVVLKSNSEVYLERMEMFSKYLVLWVRTNSLRKLQIVHLDSLRVETIDFNPKKNPELDVYSINPGVFADIESRFYRTYNTKCLTFSKSSFLEPAGMYSIALDTSNTNILFQKKLKERDISKYTQQQLFVQTLDGTGSIPLSIVYKKDWKYEARPLMMNAYGAYGGFRDPEYSPETFSFLDRGYIWAVCHPRGDGDMGASWYMKGKYEFKENTFLDVQSCINFLVDKGRVDPNVIALKGRSAGGLIAGDAIVSKSYKHKPAAVVAHVPFIDPIYDLIDETVPWTAYEWTEWGNPRNETILKAMIKYSPYHNIRKGDIPAVYVSSGVEDPRVPYWEPLKFVAKLRTVSESTIEKPILMRVIPGGHFSSSNLEEAAEWISFVISSLSKI